MIGFIEIEPRDDGRTAWVAWDPEPGYEGRIACGYVDVDGVVEVLGTGNELERISVREALEEAHDYADEAEAWE